MHRRSMRKVLIATALVATLVLPVVPAWATADVGEWEASWTSVNNWYNPCTQESVVVITDFELWGRYAVDAAGTWHSIDYSVDVSGVDSNGWIVTGASIVFHRNGDSFLIEDTTQGMWQLHLRIEDPETGQAYGGVHVFHLTKDADGDVVVAMTNNTGFSCQGQ